MKKHTLVVAEEDPVLRRFLAHNLAADGYEVLPAEDPAKALALLRAKRPDLVVVDMDGATLPLLDAIRSAEGLVDRVDPETPLLVLSDQCDTVHRVRVLERGGDDVMSKPLVYPELRARVAALLRRSALRATPQIRRVGPLAIDQRAREVFVGDQQVVLSPKEYELLALLASDPGRVFKRAELLREVWGVNGSSRTRTLDTHASRIRTKLAGAGAPARIINVWGVGYRLN